MKKIKKFGAALGLICLMAATLTGCSKTMECEGCGEEKKCKEYTVTFFGQSEDGWLCKDCVEDFESLGAEVK